jgi:hypothetical protein
MPAGASGSATGFALVVVALSATLSAHSGPPYPIVSSAQAGAYVVSVWTDPDTTDDGSEGGQFWVVLERDEPGIPPGTTAQVTVRPLGREGASRTATASPVRGDLGNQFAGVVMDHEGRFAVDVVIDGPLGREQVSAEVDATYDLRPTPLTAVLYVLPFLAVGGLWIKLLLRRRRVRPRAS